MTNLDIILKSREFTLPIQVCIVKAMVFPVVVYGCDSWTECQKIDAFKCGAGEDSSSPLDSKEIKPVSKGNQPEYSLEGLMLKL